MRIHKWSDIKAQTMTRRALEDMKESPLPDTYRVIRITLKLRKLWAMNPSQRLGQLLLNATRSEPNFPNIWNVTDERLEELIDEYIGHMQAVITQLDPELVED